MPQWPERFYRIIEEQQGIRDMLYTLQRLPEGLTTIDEAIAYLSAEYDRLQQEVRQIQRETPGANVDPE